MSLGARYPGPPRTWRGTIVGKPLAANAAPAELGALCERYALDMDPASVPGLVERFGAAVAEVGDLDTPWQGRLTAAIVRQTQGDCEDRLRALEDWTTEQPDAIAVRLVRIVTPEDLA